MHATDRRSISKTGFRAPTSLTEWNGLLPPLRYHPRSPTPRVLVTSHPQFRSGNEPVLYLSNLAGVAPENRRLMLDRLKD